MVVERLTSLTVRCDECYKVVLEVVDLLAGQDIINEGFKCYCCERCKGVPRKEVE